MRYVATLTDEEDGQITVRFPDLPGCVTCGDDVDDAMLMAADALSGHVEAMRQTGRAVPAPSRAEAIRGTLDATAMLVLVPVIEDHGSTQPVNVSLDRGLIKAIDAAAKARKMTRSAFIASAARREIIGA